MEATLTLHQAGIQLGVEDTVLSRLIRIGALPEAKKVHRGDGVAWVIPAGDLSKVATRNGWTIDLRDDAKGPTITANTAAVDEATPEEQAESATNKTGSGGDANNGNTNTGSSNGSTAAEEQAERQPGHANGSALAATCDTTTTTTETAATTTTETEHDDSPGALVPRGDSSPAPTEVSETSVEPADGAPSMSEAIDLALLDRLLGVQEERVTAQVEAREAKHALSALNATHDRTTGELEIERRERMVTADRFREERMARAVADAKVAELRDRVVREMSLADAEKEARAEALARSIRAERDAANAVASMGWRARRRYRKLSKEFEE